MLNTNISPHIHHKDDISRIMWIVNITLLPALLASVYFFGIRALMLEVASIITAVVSEAGIQALLKRKITVTDGSAVVTGLLVAFNMPVGVPVYIPIVATAFAIIIVKNLFGGLGHNIFNPALAGRVFVMFAWLTNMTTWNMPLESSWLDHINLLNFKIDTVTAATPLAVNKLQGFDAVIQQFGSKMEMYKQMFFGNTGGCLGETSELALLIGGLFLIKRRIINPLIPLIYILVVVGIAYAAGQDPLFHILSGGLFLGAFFMATDYVTSPLTLAGTIIYAAGCGGLTMLLRIKSGLPEGVSFSILLMNGITPLLDKFIKVKPYGK